MVEDLGLAAAICIAQLRRSIRGEKQLGADNSVG